MTGYFFVSWKKKSVVIWVGECTCTKILSWIFCCCHARRGCGSESCDVPMAPVNAARKDLSDKCGVQWVLTKPQGSGAAQARHHRKKHHRGAMAPPNGQPQRQRAQGTPKKRGQIDRKRKTKSKVSIKKMRITGTEPGNTRARSGSYSRSAKRLRRGESDENKTLELLFASSIRV